MNPEIIKGFFLLFFILFFPFPVLAAHPLDVIINEIAWMGTEISPYEEWIELFNTTNKEIDISSWQIENAKSKNETLTILAAKIPTKGYFLICRKEIGDCDLIESKLSLHNEYNKNGKLVLKDTTGNIIDTTPETNDKQWPAGDKGTEQTMERISQNWQTSQNPGGTPKAINSEQRTMNNEQKNESAKTETQQIEAIVYPTGIIFNEILPSPGGPDVENEWIELFNENNFAVDVSGWKIRDTVGAAKTYTIPGGTKIGSNGFLVLLRPETKITLQNSGDKLELLNPEGEIVHQINYEKAPLGESYNRTSSGWAWSTTLTPGKENVITLPEPVETKKTLSKELETENQKTEENQKSSLEKMTLAQIGEKSSGPLNNLFGFFIAIIIAISSGVIVLILRKKISSQEE